MEHRRIYRAKDKESVIQGLIKSDQAIFKEIWRVLIFACAVGYWNSKAIPLGSVDTAKGIDFQTFGNSSAWPGFVYLLSLVETEDSSALTSEQTAMERRLATFEEYANGGLSIILEKCESSNYSIDSVMSLILDIEEKNAPVGDLNDVSI